MQERPATSLLAATVVLTAVVAPLDAGWAAQRAGVGLEVSLVARAVLLDGLASLVLLALTLRLLPALGAPLTRWLGSALGASLQVVLRLGVVGLALFGAWDLASGGFGGVQAEELGVRRVLVLRVADVEASLGEQRARGVRVHGLRGELALPRGGFEVAGPDPAPALERWLAPAFAESRALRRAGPEPRWIELAARRPAGEVSTWLEDEGLAPSTLLIVVDAEGEAFLACTRLLPHGHEFTLHREASALIPTARELLGLGETEGSFARELLGEAPAKEAR